MDCRKILIVEDDENISKMIEIILKREGHRTSIADCGEKALKLVDRDRFDLILLDIMMPGINGYEVCRKIKERADFELVPVVMLSAKSSTSDKVKGLEVGADDYLTKPFVKEELIAKVKAMLRLKSKSDRLSGGIEKKTQELKTVRLESEEVRSQLERYKAEHSSLEKENNLLEDRVRELERNIECSQIKVHHPEGGVDLDGFPKGERIIGESAEVKKILDISHKVAQSPYLTVLLLGESGTGKELVARLIHRLSNNAGGPFVDINCSAIPENLLEAELFGYEKGAFTDAKARKQGLLELAHGGTIFLDEIGTIGMNFQAKLLKIIEQKIFRRIAGLEEIKVNLRIIAATNIDLRTAVEEGYFRRDLFFRLNIVTIKIPPLCERGNDLMILAEHFRAQLNREHNRNVHGFTKKAVELMKAYRWPGNVRQLKNVLERAILLESKSMVKPGDLMLEPMEDRRSTVTKPQELADYAESKILKYPITSGNFSLDKVEKEMIEEALECAKGNVSKAARILNISREKLRYRIRKLDLAATGT